MEKGIKQGTREDLQGGGLVRSAGGETAGLLGVKQRSVKEETQEYWGVGILLRQPLTSLKNCLKENMDRRKRLKI